MFKKRGVVGLVLLAVLSPVLLPVLLPVQPAHAMSPAPVTDAVNATDTTEQNWWRGAQAGEEGDAPIYRSLADDRVYRYFQLDNKLEVLLVSDPASDKSAASLDVHVGTFQNPADREGLAHFLEHMLFLGTEKYPEPGAYQAFIGEHGGSHNAYTSLEHTNYFFAIDPAYLDAALDQFAQFFVAPRFDAAYVDRERKAVESEYRLKIKDDGRREWEVLSELVNPEHPLSQFSVGSLETLADREQDPVREDLLAFYQQYYSANLMTLVVLGKEPLDQLQSMVESRFKNVKNQDTAIAHAPIDLLLEHRNSEARITPEKERRELSFLFPLESLQRYWRTKPAVFLGHLLGDEGEHSLLAELKRRGWAESLSAGTAYDSRHGAAFSMTIALTPSGVERYQQVQDASFAWIERVKRDGIVDWRYRELAELRRVDFRFLEKSPSASYARTLAAAMHDYPAAEVLRGQFDYQTFDAELIADIADKLNADNVLITLVAPEFKDLELLSTQVSTQPSKHVSKHYQAPYSVQKIAAERIAVWNTTGDQLSDQSGSQLINATLALPDKNPYLAEHFPVSEKGKEPRIPEQIINTELLRLWHYPDNQFASPRSIFRAKILSPAIASRQGTALGSLYLAMVRDQLNAEMYPAMLAGLDFSLQLWTHGLGVSVSGYTDKQSVLLARVLEVLAAPEWDEQRFARIKTQLIREWQNSRKQWPVRQVFGEVAPLLNGGHRPLELAKALAPIELAALQAFVSDLYQQGQVEAYAGGVLGKDAARAMAQSVVNALNIKTLAIEGESYQVLKLSPSPSLPRRRIDVDHADSSAVLYIQASADTLAARAQFALLQNVLEAPFYTALRTEKQLGYIVGNRIMPMHRVPGMALYVQSPVLDSAGLIGEIDGFLDSQKATVEAMSEDDLARYQQSVLSVLEERPKNLMELAGRHLESLALDYESFDFRDRLAAEVRAVSRDQLIAAYSELQSEARRGLWLSAEQGSLNEDNNTVTAEGLSELNKGQTYSYPAL
ncbi:MAG: insulinase family protein [Porticoccaceae bacterium]